MSNIRDHEFPSDYSCKISVFELGLKQNILKFQRGASR